MHRIRFAAQLSISTALGLMAMSASASVVYPSNDGFEVPNVSANTGGPYSQYQYNPSIADQGGSGWTFVGTSGVAGNNSGFSLQNAPNGNHDGTMSAMGQAAFLQQGDGTIAGPNASYFSQAITLGAGTAQVNFLLEARVIPSYSDTNILVYLDSQYLGSYHTASYPNFVSESTPAVTVAAGPHTLTFVGAPNSDQTTNDNTQFIDNVSITNVAPEPASIGLLSLAGGVFLVRRRPA